MNFYCLVNPFSGGKKGEELLSLLLDFKAKGILVGDAVKMDLAQLPEQLNDSLNFSATLVAGGDGSLNQIFQHLGNKILKLGILPLGTGNDLARESGLSGICNSANLYSTLRALASSSTQELVLWKAEFGPNYEKSFLFSNYLSIGFDAAVVADVESWRKNVPAAFGYLPRASNRLAYAVSSFKNLYESRKFSCKINALPGGEHVCERTSAILFSNIRSVMGLGISNPRSNAFDNYLEATRLSTPFNYLGMLAPPIPRGKHLGSAESWEISDLPKYVPIQIDGEARPEASANKLRISYARRIQVIWPRASVKQLK